MNDKHNTPENPLLTQAADWLDRQGEMTPQEQAEFRAWLSASPAHAQSYDLMRRAMLDPALLAAAGAASAPLPRPAPVQRLGWVGAGLAAAAAAILVMLNTHTPAPAPKPAIVAAGQDYATGHARRSDWRLADNSHLYLNADSRLHLQYLPGARNLSLARGEAIFEVAKDPARPFRVRAQGVTVTAVGTMFGVDLVAGSVAVRVYHGVVTVAGADGAPRYLHKGEWMQIDPRLAAQSGHFDPATYQSWRTDWLEADKMPLSHVVAKLNRYAPQPIRIEDAALAQRPLSGRFRLSSTDATLNLIAAALNIAQIRRDGQIVLTAHHG